MKTLTFKSAFIIPLVLVFTVSLRAQLPAYKPDAAELLVSYKRAARLDSMVKIGVFKADVKPHWISGTQQFWYRNNLKGGTAQYWLVNASTGSRKEAFDHDAMARALSGALRRSIAAEQLDIEAIDFSASGDLRLKTYGKWYEFDAGNGSCKQIVNEGFQEYDINKPLQQRKYRWMHATPRSLSPDGKWKAFIQEGNVFLKSAAGKDTVVLSQDGTVAKPYGDFVWSPDGRYLVAYHINPKKDKSVYYLLSSVSGTTRAQLESHPYAQPGDEFSVYEMFVFDVVLKSCVKVNVEAIDFFGAPELHWRRGQSRYFTFEKPDRGHQRFRVIEVDCANGASRNVIDERTNTFIYEQRIFTHYLPETHEIVWSSEKDGWRHLYITDERTGKERQITKGNWVVREIDSIDKVKRQVWFRASGMNTAEDPYFIHHYRIDFDGKRLLCLNPGIGNHQVSFSPDRRFFIDTYSQVNVAPVSELRRTADGSRVVTLERADASSLRSLGIRLPEVFVAKARDGRTDIWGVVCFPSTMDARKSYPVIENIYAGPQDSFVPKSFLPTSEMQNLAELGFIVVQIDGMGTANRSKAFHDVCWKNLADAGFSDRILWMQAMARKYPQADITRVGVYGTSAGGQNALGALLFHPEFYKAAVSACGCHDNRVDKQWWNEQWMGFPQGKHYEEQSNVTNAARLKGDLLLIVGEADTNVPPESTYRVVDALIKANKDFDFLCVPGLGHSDGGPYGRRKKRDFFVRHLLNIEPPTRNR